MNNKIYLPQLAGIIFCVFTSPSAFSVQDVYQYENQEGVTEFTDQVKKNKDIEKHIQIKQTTEEQKARGEAQLNEIIKKDKQFDKEQAKENKLEEERLQQKGANIESNNQQGSDYRENDNYDDGYYYRTPRHLINRRNPNYPDRNRPIDKPGQPVNKPARPVRPVRPISR